MPDVAGPVRRMFRLQLVVFAVTVVVATVLVAASQVQVALDTLEKDQADLFLVFAVVIPLAQLYLVVLARAGRMAELQHWTWLLLPLHLVWGSGLLVGIFEAVPIGIGLGMLDVLTLVWAKDAEAELA